MTHPEKTSQRNWSLIIGLAIPVLMTLFIAASIYLPKIFDKTPAATVDFVYSTNRYSPHKLEVINGKLEWEVLENKNNSSHSKQMPRIYLHNVTTNSSKELSLEEAKKLFLDNRRRAPDDYVVELNRHRGFFLFDGRSSRRHHLVNGHASQKLDLEYINNYYYNFKFLGWVIE